MPCVFPVLSLKVLGFAGHGRGIGASVVASGLAYTAGVVLSFVALAGAAARAARRPATSSAGASSCSRRSSSPALALLFALIGLNLLGVFESGGVLPGGLGVAARAPPGRRPRAHRRARGGGGVALHGAVHGRRARRRADPAGAAGAGGLRRARRSAWRCRISPPACGPASARCAAAAGRVDGDASRRRWRSRCSRPWSGWSGCSASRSASTAPPRCSRAGRSRSRLRSGCSRRRAARGRRRVGVRASARPRSSCAGGGLDVARAAARELAASRSPPPSPARRQALAAVVARRARRARAEGRPVFVDFTAAWCVTCQVNKRDDAQRRRGAGRRSARARWC